MTKAYDRLKDEGPQTGIDRSDLNLEERMDLRVLKVRSTTGLKHLDLPESHKGSFTTIYFLEGDERKAAERFVDENRVLLDRIDFSGKDIVQTSVSRPMYDLILDALGERVLTKYESIVLEERPDGTRWVISRDLFENSPNRRYSLSEQGSARIKDLTLQALYDEFEDVITMSDLEAHDAVASDVRWILEYYRVEDAFDCDPIGIDGELAIEKRQE